MKKFIIQGYIGILRSMTFWWVILFYFAVGISVQMSIMKSLGYSIGVTLCFATMALFIRWLESKQKINN